MCFGEVFTLQHVKKVYQTLKIEPRSQIQLCCQGQTDTQTHSYIYDFSVFGCIRINNSLKSWKLFKVSRHHKEPCGVTGMKQ